MHLIRFLAIPLVLANLSISALGAEPSIPRKLGQGLVLQDALPVIKRAGSSAFSAPAEDLSVKAGDSYGLWFRVDGAKKYRYRIEVIAPSRNPNWESDRSVSFGTSAPKADYRHFLIPTHSGDPSGRYRVALWIEGRLAYEVTFTMSVRAVETASAE
jgi:hypothetical protein